MKHDLPGNGSSVAVPIRGLPQVGDLLQVVHAVQVRKHRLCVIQEVWENVIDVARSLCNIAKGNVQVHRKILRLYAVSPKRAEGLLL